jgi:hypothetical protein
MSLSPRQIWAYVEFSEKLDRIERAHSLVVAAVGAQGDQKALDQMINELGL